jgi:hypothetical protein
MKHGGSGSKLGMLLELWLDASGIADEKEMQVRMADERNRGPRNHDAGPVVSAHGVKRYGDWRTHYPRTERKDFAGGGRMTATAPRSDPGIDQKGWGVNLILTGAKTACQRYLSFPSAA